MANRKILHLILFILLVFSASRSNGKNIVFTNQSNKHDSLELVNFAKSVLKTIKSSNFPAFALYIHPKLGIRFSPYAYTYIKTDLKFSRKKFQAAVKSKQEISWGEEDPTADAIKLTIKGYFNKYVYDVDYLKLNDIGVNKFIGGGNSLNNLKEVYKNFDFIEFHCKGIEKKYEGMDWRSVRLIVSKYKGKLYLIGVVHDEWTI